MTIKIQAYQKFGVKTEEIVDEYEFCCWQDLYNWLSGYNGLNRCPKCKQKENQNNP